MSNKWRVRLVLIAIITIINIMSGWGDVALAVNSTVNNTQVTATSTNNIDINDNTQFIADKIEITGLQRIPEETVYHDLALKTPIKIDDVESQTIINTLYQTGLFSNITLVREGNILIIQVVERPVISDLRIQGNRSIDTKTLKNSLSMAGIYAGAAFDPAILSEVQNVLLQQYINQGRYNAQVIIKIVKLANNRVVLTIRVLEGSVAKIKRIAIIGNYAFTEKLLLKQLTLSPPNLFSFFTHNDVYTEDKLTHDLDTLRFFYLDHGYLGYQLKNDRVVITPDHQHVYINISISEGLPFYISGYTISQQNNYTLISNTELQKIISFKVGERFSREKMIAFEKAVTEKLGNLGYAQARVVVIPHLDIIHHTVFLTLNIISGQKIYVRHIVFIDNHQVDDIVLRRAITQLESSLFSQSAVEDSKRSLLLLPYVKEVAITPVAVPNHPDQEDLQYKITEYPAASIGASIGYSDLYGALFNASFDEKNFLGRGLILGLGFTKSELETAYNINYYNPYYTNSGIGRGINLYYDKYSTAHLDVSDYATDRLGFLIHYTFPITPNFAYTLGYGYEDLTVHLGSSPSTQLQNFITQFGNHFEQPLLKAGWSYNSMDRALFPTKGLYETFDTTVAAPISSDSLRYYKFTYSLAYYHPIFTYNTRWLLTLHTNLGYAQGYGKYAGNYPFFENFYAGGLGNFGGIRGYAADAVGPIDSNDNHIGGNLLTTGSVGLVFPNFVGHDVRTTWFVDAGNVFNTSNATGHDLGIQGLALNQERWATGIQVEWLCPLGADIAFSLARAINPSSTDTTQFFAFNLGANF